MSAATKTYSIEGMTCSHCVAAVTQEIQAVSGVERVVVDLGAASAVVTGDVAVAEVVAAVEEAGYQVVGAPTS